MGVFGQAAMHDVLRIDYDRTDVAGIDGDTVGAMEGQGDDCFLVGIDALVRDIEMKVLRLAGTGRQNRR